MASALAIALFPWTPIQTVYVPMAQSKMARNAVVLRANTTTQFPLILNA